MNEDEYKAFEEGEQAFNGGLGVCANPYSFSQQRSLRDAWDNGYDEALDMSI